MLEVDINPSNTSKENVPSYATKFSESPIYACTLTSTDTSALNGNTFKSPHPPKLLKE